MSSLICFAADLMEYAAARQSEDISSKHTHESLLGFPEHLTMQLNLPLGDVSLTVGQQGGTSEAADGVKQGWCSNGAVQGV